MENFITNFLVLLNAVTILRSSAMTDQPAFCTEDISSSHGESNNKCCAGYQLLHGMCTKRICQRPCPNLAHCEPPNKCVCPNGYQLEVSDITNETRCGPICKNGCTDNSYCSAPNKCSCKQHFQLKDGACLPGCNSHCPFNSMCDENNDCVCNDSGDKCVSNCVKVCPKFTQCYGNECICRYDYEMIDDTCWPKCSGGCEKPFVCIGPEKCGCMEGYIQNIVEKTCIAQCSIRCPLFSICSTPNNCTCYEGYRKNNRNQCEPICQQHQCQPNSHCSTSGQCTCDDGYSTKAMTISGIVKCEPICTTECQKNSYCAAPDRCECLSDYIKNPNTKDHDDAYCILKNETLLSECQAICKCWIQEQNSSPNPACESFCENNHDQSCINMRNCTCDIDTNTMNCKSDNDPPTNTIKRFNCQNLVTSTTPFKSISTDRAVFSTKQWLITLIAIIVCIVIIAFGIIGRYCLKQCIKHNEEVYTTARYNEPSHCNTEYAYAYEI